jgi:mono/diheme cytochrome c family protein
MGGFRAVLTVATSLCGTVMQLGRKDRMSTISRFNRRDFLKVAAPAALAATQGIAPAQSREPEDAQPKYMPVFFNDAEWVFVNAAVDRLIPADAQGPGGVEPGVPVFIDRQLDMPYGHGAYFYMQGPFHTDAPSSLGYQLQYTPRELYRLGIAAADSACKQAKGRVFSDNGRARFAYDERTDRELASGDAKKRGALLYLDNCAACHRPDGRGYEGVFPSLAGNPVVEAGDPLSLVSIVLLGSTTSRTSMTPAQFAMPAFAWRLTDQDAADIISFIRTSWGNDAKPIEAPKVAALRSSAKFD